MTATGTIGARRTPGPGDDPSAAALLKVLAGLRRRAILVMAIRNGLAALALWVVAGEAVHVDGGAEQLRERPEQIDDSFRVRDDVCGEDAVLLAEREAVAARAKPAPDRCLGLLASE